MPVYTYVALPSFCTTPIWCPVPERGATSMIYLAGVNDVLLLCGLLAVVAALDCLGAGMRCSHGMICSA